MSSRRRNRRRGDRFGGKEDLNPMNYVSNLSDVMLVLAVGIMVALILHWNVQINESDTGGEDAGSQDEAISFTDDELQGQEELPDDMERMGDVYYDAETGTYYIVQDTDTDK